MEMFFKPVHSPSALDDIKPRRHHHHHQHHQDSQSHMLDGSSQFAGYTMFDDTDKNANERYRHSYHHHHDLHENPHHEAHYHHHTQQLPYSEEDEMHYNYHTPITVSRTLSSSISSSSSSTSSSSWHTEACSNNPFSALHAVRPQHSLSCSNILDVRRGFQEDDSNEPVVFASIKHGTKGTVSHELLGSSQQRGKHVFSSLDRGHSRSEEGPLHDKESDLGGEYSRSSHMNGPMYKTASLNRSLAFSEEDIQRGPKKAVSSSQLPSKGILNNREPTTDIRKAKSMEVLSPRVSKTQVLQGQKNKGITQAAIEQARANFVQGKLQFSAFLDEITKQVISPSDLTILGMNNSESERKSLAPLSQIDIPIKPQLPPKKHRENTGEERKHHPKQHNRQEKGAFSGTRHHSGFSISDKLISYSARNHHGSPPPHTPPYCPSHNSHHGSRHKNRRPSPTGGSVQRDRFGRCGLHFTDGSSNSPEPIAPKQPHHHHNRKLHPTMSHLPHTQPFHQTPPQQVHSDSGHQRPTSSSSSSAQCAGAGLGSESSSSKSDSSRARETASTAISEEWQTPSEKNDRHNSHHVGHSKQCRDTLSEATHLRVLQEENADLHQNLLQTVVCIESLEVELQRTKDELSHVKEKYKSLLEMHTGTKKANDLLGEHLHIASENLSSERKFLLNRVSQLSSELEAAHRTISALENINMPCLIKDLLETRFDSAESIQKFLKASAPISCSATSPQEKDQSQPSKVDEESHDQLTNPEKGQQRVTAFIPFKQGVPKITAEASLSNQQSTHSQPISVTDITTAIYKKMAAGYAARPQPLYPQSQQQPPLGTCQNDTPSNLQSPHVGGDCWGGEGGVKVTLLEHDVVDVTSMTAQQILNDFMEQLQAHKDVGGEPEPRVRQEWVGGAEQTDKMAN